MLNETDLTVSFHDQMAEVENNAWQNRDEKNDQKRRAAIKDDLYQHDLPTDRETVESVELEVERRVNGPADAPFRKGDDWELGEETSWIWDQWIAQGYCNVLIAAQKTGKSTFFLSLVTELSKRTGEYLNFSLSCEKKELGFLLIGPDMNRRLWGDYGQKAGLLTPKDNGKLTWASSIEAVYTEETGIGLDAAGIKIITQHCKEIAAQGKHPFVICDSYSALMANSHPNVDENSANYTNPLRRLKRALGKEGATLLMIHHSSISGSKRDTANSASGHQNWGRVPDQILSLKWLQAEVGPDGSRADNRVVLSATGRTGSVAKAQLLEQSPNWGWKSHGDTCDALAHRYALEQRDKLMGDDATLYDLLNIRTQNDQCSSVRDLQELHESTSRSSWNQSKIRRLIKKLERKCLVFPSQEMRKPPGDFGGRPSLTWWTFEKGEEETSTVLDLPPRPGAASSTLSAGFVASETLATTSSVEKIVYTQGDPHQSNTLFPESNLPTVHMMVEDENGGSSSVIKELLPSTGEVRTQAYGFAQAPIKTKRWLIDVFPFGTYAKAHPVVIDDSEII